MTDSEQKELVASVVDQLAALTANQATIIELLNQSLPDLSETEQLTIAQCAAKNYEIAENLQNVLKMTRDA